MQLTNEKDFLKKKILTQKIYKYFLLIYIFFVREKYFFNGNFLTKLDEIPELNKFET